MTDYQVDISYFDRMFDTIEVSADDKDQAEYQALNELRDGTPDATNIEVVEVRQVG